MSLFKRKHARPVQSENASRLRMLRDCISRLASSPDEQVAYIRKLGTYPNMDELALELEDAMMSVEYLRVASVLNAEHIGILRKLDAMLGRMSGEGKATLWTEEGIRTGEEWTEVRGLAVESLLTLPKVAIPALPTVPRSEAEEKAKDAATDGQERSD